MATAASGDGADETADDRATAPAPDEHPTPGRESSADQTDTREAVEIAKEIVLDLRAEFPRLDARAAAGVALSGALLVSIVTQQILPSAIYYFGIFAAVFLTLALLSFLVVLYPGRSAGWRYVDKEINRWNIRQPKGTRGEPAAVMTVLTNGLIAADRLAYYSSMIYTMSAQVLAKQRLLRLAFVFGLLAVAVLAVGATSALLMGYR